MILILTKRYASAESRRKINTCIRLCVGLSLLLCSCRTSSLAPPGGRQDSETPIWVRTGGPLGGMGYDIRIHPQNPDLMYVTDAEAGVFKSVDGGKSWRPINNGITTRTGTSGDLIPIFCISLDPGDPEVLWAGTQGQSGIYRSGNGGESWTPMNNGIIERDLTFRGFTVHPSNSDIVFAAAEVPSREWAENLPPMGGFDRTKGVVYKTINGGGTWRRVWYGDNLARYILIDPRNPDVMYVSTGIFDRYAADTDTSRNFAGGTGVLKSNDGGESWFTVNRGLQNLYIGSLAMNPENPDILMAGVGNLTFYQNGGVYLSTDSGENWSLKLDRYEIEAVDFAKSDPDIAYAANAEGMYRSEDGGRTWESMLRGHGEWWGEDGLSIGQPIDIDVDPYDPNRLFVNAYGGGAFLSTDGGRTWTDASRGYTGAQVRDIDVFPGSDSRVIAASRSGIFISDNMGDDWGGRATGDYRFLDWHTVSVNPEDPDIILSELTCMQQLVRSIDGGRSWTLVDQLNGNIAWSTIEFSPSDPRIVFCGTTGYDSCGSLAPGHSTGRPASGIRKSTDGGATWEEVNSQETETLSIFGIAIHPGNPDIVLCGSDGSGLWKTSDGGDNWERIGDSVFLDRPVSFVTFHSGNPELIFAGSRRGGLHVSRDGGETWEITGYGLNPEATPSDMAFDPNDTSIIYLADVLSGVFRSSDGGREWRPLNNGLSVRSVNALALTDDGAHLYAATEGAGVFRLDLE